MNSNSRFFFIYLDNLLAGYLKLNIDSAQTEKIDRNGLEIERIYIRKEYKRQGLGRQLLEFAIELATKERRKLIWLGVWEENENALLFYQMFGFRKNGTHNFYIEIVKELGRTIKNDVSC
jgi:ribosomal protein S18 acetylase RimI-like enzyme